MHGGPAYRGGGDLTPGVALSSGGEATEGRPKQARWGAGGQQHVERMEKKNKGKRGSEVGGGSYGGPVVRAEREEGGRGVQSVHGHMKRRGAWPRCALELGVLDISACGWATAARGRRRWVTRGGGRGREREKGVGGGD
jgi:hypothetical protein